MHGFLAHTGINARGFKLWCSNGLVRVCFWSICILISILLLNARDNAGQGDSWVDLYHWYHVLAMFGGHFTMSSSSSHIRLVTLLYPSVCSSSWNIKLVGLFPPVAISLSCTVTIWVLLIALSFLKLPHLTVSITRKLSTFAVDVFGDIVQVQVVINYLPSWSINPHGRLKNFNLISFSNEYYFSSYIYNSIQ